jgi:pentatricopeptide repeat protein
MLERYCEASLEPKDYVLLFRTYVAVHDVASAEKAFRLLGADLTAMMVNLVLLTCVKAKEPERAYLRLLDAWALEEKRPKKNEEDEPIVDIVSYNTVIKGFAQAGTLSRCFDCLHEMRARNLEPDDVTLGTLLDSCIADNDMNAANQIVTLLMRGDRPVDTVMCTLFIKGLVRAQKLPKAIELYEEMKLRKAEGTRPDIVTYSVLVKACVDSHNLERALLFVDDMAADGLSPDDIILTHLLEGCRYVGNHALGKKLFEDMLAAGVKPSNYTLITMVKLHGRCGAHDDAYRLVRDWEKQHLQKPSVIHYTCLMSGCLRTRNFDQAWQAYQLMLEMKVQADEQTITTLLPGMVAAQQWERVLMLARAALKPGAAITVPAQTLNDALMQMRAVSDQAELALQLQMLMQQSNVRIQAPRNMRVAGPPGLAY